MIVVVICCSLIFLVKDFTMGALHWISLNVFQGVDVWLVEDDKEIKQQLLK